MFEMIKPQLIIMLVGAANVMAAKADELATQAGNLVPGQHTETRIVLYTRAGIWADAAAMIRKSITQ